MNKFKIGVIGCGRRGGNYLRYLKQYHENEWVLYAVADLLKEAREEKIELYGDSNTRQFEDYKELLKLNGLDGIIIASPNSDHYEQAIAAMDMDAPILLEKPVAVNNKECTELLNKKNKLNRTVLVGFCLRYTPFYTKVKSLISEGEIGDILSINASEYVHRTIVLMMLRNWRSKREKSGSFILEKCAHDFDIFNWLIGSEIDKISSFENNIHFIEKNKPAERCSVCPQADTCIYHSDFNIFTGENCVYSETEYPDHQVVNIIYKNGVTVGFTYAWCQAYSSRTIEIFGTKGAIRGDVKANKVEVIKWNENRKEESIKYDIATDGSSHNGGDASLSRAFFKAVSGKNYDIKAELKDGVDAAIAAYAADLSARSGEIIEMHDLY